MKWFALLLLVKTVFSGDHNPDENLGINDPKLFEGDMILSAKQRYNAEHGLDVDGSDRRKRATIKSKLWPGGVVVYAIHANLARHSRAMAAIRKGMNDWTTKTCIQFKPRTHEAAFVYFHRGSGCSSYVGRQGRGQSISLASGCWYTGIVAHEIGHALGFYHEQSRPDRDNFVTILWGNIAGNRRNNFRKYPVAIIDSLNTPYDYGSVMHYTGKAFSRNGRPTILAKKTGVVMGQRWGLSTTDALQANLLYKSLCTTPPPPPSGCSNYNNLTESYREKDYRTARGVLAKCDRSLQKAWYRFTGAAGKQMPTQVVPINHCGTHASGWLWGVHPTVAQGVVQRTVCFHWQRSTCQFSRLIRVENCSAFYVYELGPTPWPHCSLSYCGDDLIEPPPPPPVCSSYKNLTESYREKDYRLVQGVSPKCDRSLQKAWYRFTGAAGKQMPTQVVPVNHCGTLAPGWLNGVHPTVAEGVVKRTVCFHWGGLPCRWSREINVENCGAFFVYELGPTPQRYCSLSYCGDDLMAPTAAPIPG